VLAVAALSEMPNPNPIFSVKFCWSNHLIRRGLVGVIPKINRVHVVKSC
jgi:hypothetical protein